LLQGTKRPKKSYPQKNQKVIVNKKKKIYNEVREKNLKAEQDF